MGSLPPSSAPGGQPRVPRTEQREHTRLNFPQQHVLSSRGSEAGLTPFLLRSLCSIPPAPLPTAAASIKTWSLRGWTLCCCSCCTAAGKWSSVTPAPSSGSPAQANLQMRLCVTGREAGAPAGSEASKVTQPRTWDQVSRLHHCNDDPRLPVRESFRMGICPLVIPSSAPSPRLLQRGLHPHSPSETEAEHQAVAGAAAGRTQWSRRQGPGVHAGPALQAIPRAARRASCQGGLQITVPSKPVSGGLCFPETWSNPSLAWPGVTMGSGRAGAVAAVWPEKAPRNFPYDDITIMPCVSWGDSLPLGTEQVA